MAALLFLHHNIVNETEGNADFQKSVFSLRGHTIWHEVLDIDAQLISHTQNTKWHQPPSNFNKS